MTKQMAAKLVFTAAANFPGMQSRQLDATAALWLESFRKYEDKQMETALRLALFTCKYFPTVADLEEAVTSLRYNEQTVPKLPMADDKRINPKISELMSRAANGELHELATGIDIRELKTFARSRYPNLSDELIRLNCIELIRLKEEVTRCERCGGPEYCPTGQYAATPRLAANGYITLAYDRCSKWQRQPADGDQGRRWGR